MEIKTDQPKRLVPDRLPPPCDETDKFAAEELIRRGKKLGDELMVEIGKARVRILENRATLDDFELLHIDPK